MPINVNLEKCIQGSRVNNIGAEGAKALAANQSLTSLDVSNNKKGNITIINDIPDLPAARQQDLLNDNFKLTL